MNRSRSAIVFFLTAALPLVVLGCKAKNPRPSARISSEETAVSEMTKAAPSASPSELFGDPPDPSLPNVALASITSNPREFADARVRTRGEIARVCQSMGCWMELRADAQSEAIRVPMAGHRFFVPKNAAGRRATVEGRISLRPLSEGMKAHLRAEGAQATEVALAIEADSVLIE